MNNLQINDEDIARQYADALAAYRQKEWNQAKTIVLDLVRKSPTHVDGLKMLGDLLFKLNHPQEAIQVLKSILQIKPDDMESRLTACHIYLSMNDTRSAFEWIEIVKMLDPNHPEFMELYNHVWSLHRKTIPPILFITLPKSGSVYIWDMLAQGLKIEKCAISCRYFPDDCIVRTSLQSMLQGGVISQSHIPASTINKLVIKRYLDKIIVHVRDPRQALLSWTHFVNKLHQDNVEDVHFVLPPLPDNYFEKKLTEQIDWQIDNYLPLCVQWIEGWMDADEDPEFHTELLFTQYEKFVREHDAFFNDILDFYKIKPEQFQCHEKLIDKKQLHFRKGLTDEWREVFTPEQIERSASVLTGRIVNRFGWSY